MGLLDWMRGMMMNEIYNIKIPDKKYKIISMLLSVLVKSSEAIDRYEIIHFSDNIYRLILEIRNHSDAESEIKIIEKVVNE